MTTEDNKPSFALTVGELKEILREIVFDLFIELQSIENSNELENYETDMIYLQEVAEITGYKEKTIYTKVSRGEIPVVTSGKPLTFSRKQIEEWIKKGRPSVAEMTVEKIRDRVKRRNSRRDY